MEIVRIHIVKRKTGKVWRALKVKPTRGRGHWVHESGTVDDIWNKDLKVKEVPYQGNKPAAPRWSRPPMPSRTCSTHLPQTLRNVNCIEKTCRAYKYTHTAQLMRATALRRTQHADVVGSLGYSVRSPFKVLFNFRADVTGQFSRSPSSLDTWALIHCTGIDCHRPLYWVRQAMAR